jgi:ribokinase
MAAPKVVVVGSCMMDVVVHVPRLPARGETVVGRSVATHVGGKGTNQAIAAARLGADVSLVGRVGADEFGDRVLAAAREAAVNCDLVVRDPANATGTAVPIVFDDGTNSIIAVPQANAAMSLEDVARAAPLIAEADVLLLQFEVPMHCVTAAARLAGAHGLTVILNTAPVAPLPAELAGLVGVVVANEWEAAALVPSAGPEPEAQVAALVALGIPSAVVTLGGLGAAVGTATSVETMPAFPAAAVDTVGAGDAFCGALAVALGGGKTFAASVEFAQAAAALSTERHGAAASLPALSELHSFLARLGRPAL